ncbi:nucleotide-binding protein [Shewanella sp. DW31]|uniref:TIR domain-containing protein n=1 Tax=Shewanella sp. DW31 TaxID=2699422 RepID=UPI0018E381D9|nr:nucleotide-binding protein [Shewanella sp. DW31]MBI1673759.1 nucleotide-binding protein [Shewanella sp. DW31]
MEKQEIIDGLERLKERLLSDVYTSFNDRGANYGARRFVKWKHVTTAFLEENMPREVKHFNALFVVYSVLLHRNESDADYFWITDGEKTYSYLDSLILDIKNDEYDFTPSNKEVQDVKTIPEAKSKKVLIVHGHDEVAKYRTDAFLSKHGFEPIILHLKASSGDTIIQKLERLAKDVGYGVVLYTPDDMGETKSKAAQNELQPRARQNVIFEHGYLMGLIGRPNVAAIVEGHVEKPGDIDGVVYISSSNWEMELLRELRDAGYPIDPAKL